MWPFKKSIKEYLAKTTRVKVCGMYFRIRKVNPLDFMAGAQVLQQHFDTYKTKGEKREGAAFTPIKIEAVKKHTRDVLMCGVVEPPLTRNPKEEGLYVDYLMTDWFLAEELFRKIMELTHGKKKVRRATLQAIGLSKLTR